MYGPRYQVDGQKLTLSDEIFSISLLDSNIDLLLFQSYIQMSKCNVRVDRMDLHHSGTKNGKMTP